MKHLFYKLMRRIKGIKIAVIISYKYDKDYLPDCIENIKDLTDVLVLKEDIHGDLLKFEGKYRQQMIQQAKNQGANWVFVIDPDERLERNGCKVLHDLILKFHGQKVMFKLNFKELYTPNSYRIDGMWNNKIRVPIFPVREDNIFSDARLHAPKQPLNQDYEVIDTGLNLYHLKHINPKLIQHRRDLYTKLDPHREFQSIGYDYLTDETSLELQNIPTGREYFPVYRDYQMDKAIFDNI